MVIILFFIVKSFDLKYDYSWNEPLAPNLEKIQNYNYSNSASISAIAVGANEDFQA